MSSITSEKVKLLVETYQYVYLTELDHDVNITDIAASAGMKFEDVGYFPMWQRSRQALDNLEEYLRVLLVDSDDGPLLRDELDKLKVFNTLAGKATSHIDRILRL